MSKRTLIIAAAALVLLLLTFLSLFLEKQAVQKEYDDLLNGNKLQEKEPEAEAEPDWYPVEETEQKIKPKPDPVKTAPNELD